MVSGSAKMTSPDAFTGENFRRAGFLPRDDRYERAAEFIEVARMLWDSHGGCFTHEGDQFTIEGEFDIPGSPQGYPVMIQAGDSDGGRELAAKHADVIFTRHSGFTDGKAFFADVKPRLAKYGRGPEDLKIIPAATAVVGDTDEDAAGARGPHPHTAGEPAGRDRVRRAAVGPGSLGLRPRRSAPRRRSGCRGWRLDHAGAVCATTRTRWRSRRSGEPSRRQSS